MRDYIFRLQLDISTWFFVLVFVVTISFLLFAYDLKDVLIFIAGVMVWLSALMSTIYLIFVDESDELHDWQ